MDNFFDNDPWTSVADERAQRKKAPKNLSPGATKDVQKGKKPVPPKRRSQDLHSASSVISKEVEKKKIKTVGLPKAQASIKGYFNTVPVVPKAIPGTAVLSKVPPAMSLKPKPPSPTMLVTTMNPPSPIIHNYDNNIAKQLNKINKNINRSASNSPMFDQPSKPKSPKSAVVTESKDITAGTVGTKMTVDGVIPTHTVKPADVIPKTTVVTTGSKPANLTHKGTLRNKSSEHISMPRGSVTKASSTVKDPPTSTKGTPNPVIIKPSRLQQSQSSVQNGTTVTPGQQLSGHELHQNLERAASSISVASAKEDKHQTAYAAYPKRGEYQPMRKPSPAESATAQAQRSSQTRAPWSPRGGSRTLARAMRGRLGRGGGRDDHMGRSPLSGRSIFHSRSIEPEYSRLQESGDGPSDIGTYRKAFAALESFDKTQSDQSSSVYSKPSDSTKPRVAERISKKDRTQMQESSPADQRDRTSVGESPNKGQELLGGDNGMEQRNVTVSKQFPRLYPFEEEDLVSKPTAERPTNSALPGNADYRGGVDYPTYQGRYSPRFPLTEDGYIPYPPTFPQSPYAYHKASFRPVLAPASTEASEDREVARRNRQIPSSRFKTPETDDEESTSHQPSRSSSSSVSHPLYTEISHYTGQVDTSSMGHDLSMESAEGQEDEEPVHQGPIVDTTNELPDDHDFHPQTDGASAATEPQSNSLPASDNRQGINYSSSDDDSSSGSDDSDGGAERETRCPSPERPVFYRYDVVVNIPKNNNPTETVANLIADVMQILVGVDQDIILYPYRATYELPPLLSAETLIHLGNDLHKYVDKGKFDRFSARAVPNCRLSIALGSGRQPVDLCGQARDQLHSFNMQMYPKLLNYPAVVRAGFLLYSHKHHHSESFQEALPKYISRPVASKWRRAATTIDLHQADYATTNGKQAFIPSAICFECQEQDLALVRAQLQALYPLQPKPDRFDYPREAKATFCNTYNRYELDQVDEQSKETAKQLWHIQLLANQRERYVSFAHLLKKARHYARKVVIEGIDFLPVRRFLLDMTVPYTDSRGEHPSLFTSVDDVLPFDSSTRDYGVTFRPQHAKYAQNVIENLAMHFEYRCGCSRDYILKVFKSEHIQMMRGKRWHVEHEKAFDPKNTQEGLSAIDLSLAMTEFNLDITVVLQDAAMAGSRAAATTEGDGVSAPREASNASQQLSMLNSITTFRAPDEEMAESDANSQSAIPAARPTPNNPYAWTSRPGATATRISHVSPSTAGTSTTRASVDTPTTQTALVQEDSSLTTTTEPIGITEAQLNNLLAAHDRKWQAKLAVEVALRVAEHDELNRKTHLERRIRLNQTRDQTARLHGGGQVP
jgi:hypothetical protein